MLHAVIMAGGSGIRFWPESRRARPKQLLPLAGERTLLQQTVDRLPEEISPDRIWIVTGEPLVNEIQAQLPQIPADRLIVEPCGRNTAPCIGLAAVRIVEKDPAGTMLVLPADHAIEPVDDFRQAARAAEKVVEQSPESLLLFGCRPDRPETGYGYIQPGETAAEIVPQADSADHPQVMTGRVAEAAAFREKPDEATAKKLVENEWLWNCGIFCWKAGQILAELRKHQPELAAGLARIAGEAGTSGWSAAINSHFADLPGISIDHGVLEHAGGLLVMEAPFTWDDLGSWEAIFRRLPLDSAGNAIDASHAGFATGNCGIRSTDRNHLIATFGVDDLVIVHTEDATLVARRNDPDSLRRLVAMLEDSGERRWL